MRQLQTYKVALISTYFMSVALGSSVFAKGGDSKKEEPVIGVGFGYYKGFASTPGKDEAGKEKTYNLRAEGGSVCLCGIASEGLYLGLTAEYMDYYSSENKTGTDKRLIKGSRSGWGGRIGYSGAWTTLVLEYMAGQAHTQSIPDHMPDYDYNEGSFIYGVRIIHSPGGDLNLVGIARMDQIYPKGYNTTDLVDRTSHSILAGVLVHFHAPELFKSIGEMLTKSGSSSSK